MDVEVDSGAGADEVAALRHELDQARGRAERAEAVRAGQQRVLELLARGRELPRILEGLARTIEGMLDGVMCAVMLLDEDRLRLRMSAAPNLPQEYTRAVDGIAVGPRVLTSGAAAHRGERVIARDIASDPVWENFKQWGLDAELAASWSQPIRSATGEVVGTFDMYLPVSREPSRFEVGIMEMAADLAGIAFERKRGDQELRKAIQMAELANDAKGRFLANMSHEIRTPLNAVIGMTGLLIDTELSPKQREFADTIRTGGEALLSVLNDILDFSKVEAGRMELEMAPFALRRCVEEAVDLVAAAASDKGLELCYAFGKGVPDFIVGDRTRLRQVLTNLLTNAVKFTSEGEVVVRVEVQGVRGPRAGISAMLAESRPGGLEEVPRLPETHSTDHRIRFSVRDTGIGIPKDRQHALFQPFSQVDASTTRRFGGTGLGLAISQRLIHLMGGDLWVESESGTGSVFHVDITAEGAEPPEEAGSITGFQPSLAGRHVLVVDDNATSLGILRGQMEAWGMLAVGVAGADEALETLRNEPRVDLVLLDMILPGQDSLALARAIHLELDRPVPLVALSTVGSLEAASAPQFSAKLVKPVRQAALYDTVRAVVAGDAAPSPRAPGPLAPKAPEGRSPLRVLVAEDNLVNQKVALHILERLGYSADVATNGLEVVMAVRNRDYDVVLMDVQMPEMDGFEACRRIRRMKSDGAPYIVAMTANAMAGDRERCLAEGMDDYIGKPVRVTEMEAVLERVPVRR